MDIGRCPHLLKLTPKTAATPERRFSEFDMLITRTFQLSPNALNILDAIAAEMELHDLSEAVEYCILKQKLNEKELAHALLVRLSTGSLRRVDDENS